MEREAVAVPQVLLVNPQSTPSPHKVFEPNIYPHIGLLTLATALEQAGACRGIAVEVLYYDGALLGDAFIRDYIAANARRIALVGYSAVTLNYGSCVALASHAKACRPGIVNVIGNDHFSALHREVMSRRQGVFDYGFCGNDVVEGFTAFTLDTLCGRQADPATYAGLVVRDAQAPGGVRRVPENPEEFERLPLIDYALLDSLVPHAERYHREQRQFYHYVREENLRITTIEFARGCLKFKGRRTEGGIPQNACDFCAIIPGSRALSAQKARRAWEIIRNAFESGYNYLFVTADELPSTFWPLIRDTVDEMPEWYRALAPGQRPRMMGYARADAFRERVRERIDVLMGTLGFDHFFVGLDGFTSLSLRAMNKGIQRLANDTDDLLDHNLVACREIAQRGGRLSAGAVITHMGITPALLETNFGMMRDISGVTRGSSWSSISSCSARCPGRLPTTTCAGRAWRGREPTPSGSRSTIESSSPSTSSTRAWTILIRRSSRATSSAAAARTSPSSSPTSICSASARSRRTRASPTTAPTSRLPGWCSPWRASSPEPRRSRPIAGALASRVRRRAAARVRGCDVGSD